MSRRWASHDRFARGTGLETKNLERLWHRHWHLPGSRPPRASGRTFIRFPASPVSTEPPAEVRFEESRRLGVVSAALREQGEEVPGSERIEGPALECPVQHLPVQLSGVVVDRHAQPFGLDPGGRARRGTARSLCTIERPPQPREEWRQSK